MRLAILVSVAAVASFSATQGQAASSPFDGAWTTTVTCPNGEGVLGYSFDVPTTIKNGVVHGQRMSPGEPGYLVLDGPIAPDGSAKLYAKGLVGASEVALGHAPVGTDYGYHVDAHFEAGKGRGTRVEGRPCELVFERR
jgi:hypothetical protein